MGDQKIVMNIFEYIIAFLTTIGSSSLIIKFLDDFRKQREFLAIIISLRVECVFNNKHRGNSQNPFKFEWLMRGLSALEFSEQCPELAKKCREILELGYDANNDQINRRSTDSVECMVPGHVQDLFKEICVDIDKMLPILDCRAQLMGYLWWYITQSFYCVILRFNR